MEWKILIAQLSEDVCELDQSSFDFPLPFILKNSLDDSLQCLVSESIAILIIVCNEFDEDSRKLLRTYQSYSGGPPEYLCVVSKNDHAEFLASFHEFGIDQFLSTENWVAEARDLITSALLTLNDHSSSEYKALSLAKAIHSADRTEISSIEDQLKELAEYDFRAAFAHARSKEAAGDYASAINSYGNARELNEHFRPSSASLGENLIITGRVGEALELLQEMEATYDGDPERKALLASAYATKGDFERASEFIGQAEILSPQNNKVLEAKALMLLESAKYNEALALLDQLSQVGPLFATKLNDLGIKLSQAGKAQSALSLYNKAHKIVKPELRYKISLNIALACRRLNEYKKALAYIQRSRKEYGGNFDKIQAIETTIKKEIQQKNSGGKSA